MTSTKLAPLTDELEAYLNRYCAFPNDEYAFVLALWVIGTYLWTELDVFPYLSITAATKRAGKTQLAELLRQVSPNGVWMTGATGPTIFYMIRDEKPVMFIDEGERLSSESAGLIREAMNTGYKRGQTIPRVGKGEKDGSGKVEHWDVYCPKAFVLIGDVNDTLRDRSIVLTMRRASPMQIAKLARMRSAQVAAEAGALGERTKVETENKKAQVLAQFDTMERLDFLSARDEEIWEPLFAVARVFAPARVEELKRIAVDLATEKTAEAREFSKLQAAAEGQAQDEEYGVRLLRDMLALTNGAPYIYTAQAVEQLQAIPTAPWRRYLGTGITNMLLASMLSRFGVEPKYIRSPGKGKERKGSKVARGYRREDLEAAVKKFLGE